MTRKDRKTIDEIRVAIAVDRKTGDEGVVAHQLGDQWFPLIAADDKRFAQIEAMAQMVAEVTGQTITMARFTTREDLQTIKRKVPS